jgi:hypothetical protein
VRAVWAVAGNSHKIVRGQAGHLQRAENPVDGTSGFQYSNASSASSASWTSLNPNS